MLYLFFDTETTGLPLNYKTPGFTHPENWPYIVQFSFILYDSARNKIITIYDEIVRLPPGIRNSNEASEIHGITDVMCEKRGVPIECALDNFLVAFELADRIIAHNYYFDINMIQAEMARNQMQDRIEIITSHPNKKYCTMLNSVNVCKIPSNWGYKWPKLIELHEHLFRVSPQNLHNSMNDVVVCMRNFFQLTEQLDITHKNRTVRKMMRPLLTVCG